jgi:hypothetical protein
VELSIIEVSVRKARNLKVLLARILAASVMLFASDSEPTISIIIGAILKTISFGNSYGVFIIAAVTRFLIVHLPKCDRSMLDSLQIDSDELVQVRRVDLPELRVPPKTIFETLFSGTTLLKPKDSLGNCEPDSSTLLLFACFLS